MILYKFPSFLNMDWNLVNGHHSATQQPFSAGTLSAHKVSAGVSLGRTFPPTWFDLLWTKKDVTGVRPALIVVPPLVIRGKVKSNTCEWQSTYGVVLRQEGLVFSLSHFFQLFLVVRQAFPLLLLHPHLQLSPVFLDLLWSISKPLPVGTKQPLSH